MLRSGGGGRGGAGAKVGAPEAAELPGGEVRGRQPLELYLKEVQLHPVSVRVSVQMGMACDEAELQEWHPTNSLVGLARHLGSLHASSPTSP